MSAPQPSLEKQEKKEEAKAEEGKLEIDEEILEKEVEADEAANEGEEIEETDAEIRKYAGKKHINVVFIGQLRGCAWFTLLLPF